MSLSFLQAVVAALLFALPQGNAYLPKNQPVPTRFPAACGDEGLSRFHIEIQNSNRIEHPTFTVTNLCEEPATGLLIQESLSSSTDRTDSSMMVWDSYLQNQPPIGKDQQITLPLGHVVGHDYRDTVEVSAAILADGSTLGDAEHLKIILGNRASRLDEYEWAVSLLRRGLEENWTKDRYFAELDQHSKSGIANNIRKDVEITGKENLKPRVLRNAMESLLDRFVAQRKALRMSKPVPGAPDPTLH